MSVPKTPYDRLLLLCKVHSKMGVTYEKDLTLTLFTVSGLEDRGVKKINFLSRFVLGHHQINNK